MHARTTQLEIDTVRVPMDAAVALFEVEVLPRLREQAGFVGVYVLANPDGKAMLVSFWETAADADVSAADGWYPAVLDEYVTLFRSPPGRERYEVRLAVPPVPAGAPSRDGSPCNASSGSPPVASPSPSPSSWPSRWAHSPSSPPATPCSSGWGCATSLADGAGPPSSCWA